VLRLSRANGCGRAARTGSTGAPAEATSDEKRVKPRGPSHSPEPGLFGESGPQRAGSRYNVRLSTAHLRGGLRVARSPRLHESARRVLRIGIR